jgi:hypothetical protein
MTKPKAKPTESFMGTGLQPEEVSTGKVRYNEYRKIYPQLNKLSNLTLLEELVWLECLQERYKKQVGLITEPHKQADGTIKSEPIPKHIQEAIVTGLERIVDLKTKLGLFEDQKTLDAYKDLNDLFLKAAIYRKEHPLEFKCTCPHCTKIFFLKRRTTNYEEFISPFFPDDKVLKNTPLYLLYKNGKIDKTDFASVLGVSEDYVEWLEEKIYKNSKHKA